MRKKIIIFLMFFSVITVYASVSLKEQAAKSAESYNNGNYEDSIKEYELMILNGINNPYVYYNLSNSYYKNNNIGRASLNIERALRLAPRDKDIRYNRSFIAKLSGEPQRNAAEQIVYEIKLLFSLNELVTAFFIITVFLCVSAGIYFLRQRKNLLKVTIVCFVVFSLNSVMLYFKFYDEVSVDEAIVLSDTQVRNKPIKSEDGAFAVLAGRKVIILSELGRWVNIKLSVDGFSGWIDKNYIEKI
ncbi:MAG: hypothetical protein WC234_04755 [Endomicrobiaceae bacterium]